MQDSYDQNLPPGSIIDHYEVREILGIGGFGVTYKAWDKMLDRWVAIKEFLPMDLAVRDQASTTIKARSDRTDDYQFALEKFLQEAKTLARFDHPNIVRVSRFLEANGTGYLVMDFVEGQSLSQYLKRNPGSVSEAQLQAWFVPILRGLVRVHDAGFLHRDIKPGNIYLRDDGEPLLIDFGAARQAIGEHSRSVTGIVSAGYAPTEQYGTDAKKQGPWTDLYSLGATLYRCMTGKDPVDAPTRQSALFEGDPDPLPGLKGSAGAAYSDRLLLLAEDLLVLPIKLRPQSALHVLDILDAPPQMEPPYSPPDPVVEEPRSTVVTQVVQKAKAEDFRPAPEPEHEPKNEPADVAPEAVVAREPVAMIAESASPESPSHEAVKASAIGAAASGVLGSRLKKRTWLGVAAAAIVVCSAALVRLLPEDSSVQNSLPGAGARFEDPLRKGGRGPEMVVLAGGQFEIGCISGLDCDTSQLPVRSVKFERFAISKYEITFEEYDTFARATDRPLPDDEGWGRGRLPVINVSWADALDYTRWLSRETGGTYRLPTEAEWELGARGGTESKYSWGNSARRDRANYGQEVCCDGMSSGKDKWLNTSPVGSFPSNSLGLYDTHGNVWEWTMDCYAKDLSAISANGHQAKSEPCLVGEGGSRLRSLRGGSWYSYPGLIRVSSRIPERTDFKSSSIGFRIVKLTAG